VRAVRLGLSELTFDLWRRTDTGLSTGDSRGPAHEGSNPLVFTEIVRRCALAGPEHGFLDVGAGKGRALLLASEAGFGRVVGVERSAALCAVACRNVGSRAEVVHADAADFPVPDDVDVAYLFDPFGAGPLERVLANVDASLARAPRVFHVVYVHPRLSDQVTGAGYVPVAAGGVDWIVLRKDPRADRAAADR
jgi:SAM-dependent methyltransferase